MNPSTPTPAPIFLDFYVETGNPKMLDATVQQLGAAAIIQEGEEYFRENGHYVMRIFGNPGFIKFACENQGYCRIVGERNPR